jgi:hypothetical protein
LREDEFRAYIKDTDWSLYADKYVAVSCTADAIVPLWAYMLVASAVEPFAKKVVFCNMESLETALYFEALAAKITQAR